MNKEKEIYRALQIHLDQQAVGFPATKSGVEIRLLKHFFNPKEAKIAIKLNYKYKSIEEIYDKVKKSGISFDELEKSLKDMIKKGAISYRQREGVKYYKNMPFVTGMYEFQTFRLTPEFIADSKKYKLAYGISMLKTKLPQMRTIPIEKSITPEHNITNYDNVKEIIKNINGPIVVIECLCRKIKKIEANPCKKASQSETCMFFLDWANIAMIMGIGRQISKEEALEIAKKNQEDGLIFQPSNSQEPVSLCACCGCCCGVLSNYKMLPRPINFWASNYYAEINSESCSGCGICIDICQMNAIKLKKSKNIYKINKNRCFGCGNCVLKCPSETICLKKKDKEVIPPKTVEDLYDVIMTNKKEEYFE